MGLLSIASKTAARARYAAQQGLRSAWYGAQMTAARRSAGGFNRPDEPKFEPSRGAPDMAALRKAYFDLFIQDRLNVEAGLYPAPNDLRLRDLPNALKSARAFREDVAEVDRRRKARDGAEIRASLPEQSNRYPDYYTQNFHYQSGGWFTDESAQLYDTQVEALFTGTADAMRRAALAEISRELKGRDQRRIRLLDLACGNGRFLSRVMHVYPRLQASGLDLSPSYTEAARKRLSRWPQVARILKPGGLFILADSTQFGDYPDMDGLLEYFPHGFHEPYYEGYLSWDMAAACTGAGLTAERETLAFLTKVATWRKA